MKFGKLLALAMGVGGTCAEHGASKACWHFMQSNSLFNLFLVAISNAFAKESNDEESCKCSTH